MLLSIDPRTKVASRVQTKKLQSFELNERDLQDILYNSMDRYFPDDELILLMQSRSWQEEPDLMAIDKFGNLFIFELKAWEAQSQNLLQVLRYGQIFGSSKYADLNAMYRKANDTNLSLSASHIAKFGVHLKEEEFNQKQIFVVITNGLDRRTREGIKYWRSTGLDVRPWIYRVYAGKEDSMLLEMSAFRNDDNPYEDLSEGYYILNTNSSNTDEDHHDMITNAKAAAYFSPWKHKIERLNRTDVVFLYQSGKGIVGFGEADGKLKKANYQGKDEYTDEEYSMKLNRFKLVSPPLSASEIKQITGINHRFMSVLFGLDSDSGKALKHHLESRSRIE